MTKIIAVRPYEYTTGINFKLKPWEAWRALGGKTTNGWYPRWLHRLMYEFDMPTLCRVGAPRLCFVEAQSVTFDTFFAGMMHEVIPFIWDCWPQHYDKMEHWLRRHKVRTAVFTSRQEMTAMQTRIPELKTIWCPEGIDADSYKAGKPLKERGADLLEFGRGFLNTNDHALGPQGRLPEQELSTNVPRNSFSHICTMGTDGSFKYTPDELRALMRDAKVTVCMPRSITHPEIAQGVETLTQRYWEAMLSRMVIVGHCPKELEELIGYNPVVEVNANFNSRSAGTDACLSKNFNSLVLDILDHIEDYQPLVDKNRETALKYGDWRERMKRIKLELFA